MPAFAKILFTTTISKTGATISKRAVKPQFPIHFERRCMRFVVSCCLIKH